MSIIHDNTKDKDQLNHLFTNNLIGPLCIFCKEKKINNYLKTSYINKIKNCNSYNHMLCSTCNNCISCIIIKQGIYNNTINNFTKYQNKYLNINILIFNYGFNHGSFFLNIKNNNQYEYNYYLLNDYKKLKKFVFSITNSKLLLEFLYCIYIYGYIIGSS
jgi:hypothetical protein